MTSSSLRRRLATWIGVSAATLLTVTGALAGIGQGAASASTPIVSTISLPTGINPTFIQQNTAATETITVNGGSNNINIATAETGQASGWTFQIADTWHAGDKLDISVKPSSGANCETKTPHGVNQAISDPTNYVGFPDWTSGKTISPIVYSQSSGETPPLFNVQETNAIPCTYGAGLPAGSTAEKTFETMQLTLLNSGQGNGSVLTVGIGTSLGASINIGGTSFGADLAAPVTLNTGYGAATGATIASASYNTAGVGIASDATITGETPSANVPPSGVSRGNSNNVPNDFTVPPTPISEFTISENAKAALPPFGDSSGIYTQFPSNAPGAVCLVIDNRDGNQNFFPSTPVWSVNPNAGTAGLSAAAGAASVTHSTSGITNDTLQLPVTAASNIPSGTVWGTTGLQIAGYSPVDGPIWATALWAQGPKASCADVNENASAYELGYVQLTTVTQAAPSIFGATTDATATAALNHQFDYAKGECIGSIYPSFINGPSLFLATDQNYPDALAASYAAGTVDSGVLLTPTNSLDPQTLDAIRLQGAQTVYVAGGPLAISDAVVSQLESTPSYLCGGVQPRVDLGTGKPENLNVIRIFGQTQYDTAQQLGEFIGAEPLGQMSLNTWGTGFFNTTSGTSSPTGPAGPVNTAILATGTNFDDAVAASAPAYADQFPIFLTDGTSLSPQALNGMFNDHIGQVILVGGPLAVSDGVVGQLEANGIRVLRVAGTDATDTSAQLASFELSLKFGLGWNNSDHEWDNFVARTSGATGNDNNNQVDGHVALLVRGDFYADALVSGELTVHNGLYRHNQALKPILLTEDPTTVGTFVTSFLNNAGLAVSGLQGASPANGASHPIGYNNNEISSSVFTLQPVGGPIALNPSTIASAQQAISAG